jgi:hypothetical protein
MRLEVAACALGLKVPVIKHLLVKFLQVSLHASLTLTGRFLAQIILSDASVVMSCKAKWTHLRARQCSPQIPLGRPDGKVDMHSCCAQEEEVAEQTHPAHSLM